MRAGSESLVVGSGDERDPASDAGQEAVVLAGHDGGHAQVESDARVRRGGPAADVAPERVACDGDQAWLTVDRRPQMGERPRRL